MHTYKCIHTNLYIHMYTYIYTCDFEIKKNALATSDHAYASLFLIKNKINTYTYKCIYSYVHITVCGNAPKLVL